MNTRISRRSLATFFSLATFALAVPGDVDAQDTIVRPPKPADTTRLTDTARIRDTARVRDTSAVADSTRLAGKPAARRRKRAADASTKAMAAPAPVWPVPGPDPLPNSLLPAKRIIAYYGNPLSRNMGILGALPPDDMLARLDKEVAAWNAADPSTPAQPALHLIAVVAQGGPGRDGKYRARMDSALIEKVYGWAQKRNALLFLDVQVGHSTLQEELPALERFLKRPNVHLGIDPEFSMNYGSKGRVPGTRIGTFDAADVNFARSFLERVVTENNLPPKVLVIHRFTRSMLTNSKDIALDPRVQIVIDMDGWGPPFLKRDSYRDYIYRHPVQYAGFKLFYKNDTKKGHPLMKPQDVLALFPKPVYIQYQ